MNPGSTSVNLRVPYIHNYILYITFCCTWSLNFSYLILSNLDKKVPPRFLSPYLNIPYSIYIILILSRRPEIWLLNILIKGKIFLNIYHWSLIIIIILFKSRNYIGVYSHQSTLAFTLLFHVVKAWPKQPRDGILFIIYINIYRLYK